MSNFNEDLLKVAAQAELMFGFDHYRFDSLLGDGGNNLARICSIINENLSKEKQNSFSKEFWKAVILQDGNITDVSDEFLLWMLTAEQVNPGAYHPLVKDSIHKVADVIYKFINIKQINKAYLTNMHDSFERLNNILFSYKEYSNNSKTNYTIISAHNSFKAAFNIIKTMLNKDNMPIEEQDFLKMNSIKSVVEGTVSYAKSLNPSLQDRAYNVKMLENKIYSLMADKIIDLIMVKASYATFSYNNITKIINDHYFNQSSFFNMINECNDDK